MSTRLTIPEASKNDLGSFGHLTFAAAFSTKRTNPVFIDPNCRENYNAASATRDQDGKGEERNKKNVPTASAISPPAPIVAETERAARR
jgi:hypothetical protein